MTTTVLLTLNTLCETFQPTAHHELIPCTFCSQQTFTLNPALASHQSHSEDLLLQLSYVLPSDFSFTASILEIRIYHSAKAFLAGSYLAYGDLTTSAHISLSSQTFCVSFQRSHNSITPFPHFTHRRSCGPAIIIFPLCPCSHST